MLSHLNWHFFFSEVPVVFVVLGESFYVVVVVCFVLCSRSHNVAKAGLELSSSPVCFLNAGIKGVATMPIL